MRGQTVSCFLEVWELITNLLDSKRYKSKRWLTLPVNDMLKSKYVAVSYDSSLLVGLHPCTILLLNLDGHEIPSSPSIRNLGVIFDYSMTMAEHITNLSRSINWQLRNLNRIRKFLDTDWHMSQHRSHFHPGGGGGTQLFFGGCVPHGFPKVGSREWIFLEKWGVLGTKIRKICVLRAEILTKTRLKMEKFYKIWKWGAPERRNDGKLIG